MTAKPVLTPSVCACTIVENLLAMVPSTSILIIERNSPCPTR